VNDIFAVRQFNMARRVTQETFDAAVLENIDLLEMSPEDAVLEAVQQFEAQVRNIECYRMYFATT